ncbi:hypothetical protein [Actinoplanes sp. NPDC023714]|uniref:hypothetical protein n=1 Tax=Actinoplanes sp. NPDC023714 TaxID=3154322 RepID=UPI0033F457E6
MSRFSLRTAVLSLGLAGVALTAGQALAAPATEPPPAPAPAAAPVAPVAAPDKAAENPDNSVAVTGGMPGTLPAAPAEKPASAPAKPAAGPAAAAKPKPVKKPAGPAVAVVVVRTGGVAGGGTSVYTLVGSDSAHTARILGLASSAEFRELRSRYIPKNRCCDRFEYTIEVGYRNGVKKRIETLAGTAGTPQVLLDVIRLMETMPAPEPITFAPGFPFN